MKPIFSRKISRVLALCLAALAMGSAAAQSVHQSHGRGHYVFRGHDVHRFQNDELIRWRGGRWSNSCFGGLCGWWWLAAGQWYFYDSPVYPYPPVVSGIGFADPLYAEPAPAVITAPKSAAPPQFWYYCDDPEGYFPAVQTCNIPFRQVPPPPPPPK